MSDRTLLYQPSLFYSLLDMFVEVARASAGVRRFILSGCDPIIPVEVETFAIIRVANRIQAGKKLQYGIVLPDFAWCRSAPDEHPAQRVNHPSLHARSHTY